MGADEPANIHADNHNGQSGPSVTIGRHMLYNECTNR